MRCLCKSVEMQSGRKSLWIAVRAALKLKLAGAVADVEDDAAFTRIPHARLQLPQPFGIAAVDDAEGVAVVAVGENVAGTHELEDLVDLGWRKTDVDHQGRFKLVAELAGDLHEIQAVSPVHIGAHVYLDSEHNVGIAVDRLGCTLDAVSDVLHDVHIRVAQIGVQVNVAE